MAILHTQINSRSPEFAAAFMDAGEQGAQVVDLGEHRRAIGGELR